MAPGDPVPASRAFGTAPLYAARTTTLTAVAHDGGTALDFDAWRSLAPRAKVDRFSTALSSDPRFQTDPGYGIDGGDDSFDMGAGDFSMSMWLQPTPATAFPRGSLTPEKVSPNVAQKGRANAVGGYWKVYLQMVRSNGTVVWSPVCVITGGDGRSAAVNKGAKATLLANGVGAVITCARVGGVLRMTVTPDGGPSRTTTKNTAGAIDVSNPEALSVGHKPGTTNAADVYDGLLAHLSISMG